MTERENVGLVVGGTRLQGGAVARRLPDANWRVRFLTRNAESDESCCLVGRGASVVVGDLEDVWEHGFVKEVRQRMPSIEAAVATKVAHFVDFSVGVSRRAGGPQRS
ncbi:NmrA family NAD(P)-binding protein [Variovorax flavidus]|uniref:NmrA family NAD(P)-binding protein n=1 Tax=Variovorax flavidus TaxID=3053501 RepID=UPI0033654BC9